MASPRTMRVHGAFIVKRIAITAASLAFAPFFLAFHGAPTGPQTLIFALSFAPLAAALLAAGTGRLAFAHSLASLALVGLSLSLWLGFGCSVACVIVWLVVAQLEATLAADTAVACTAAGLNGCALLFVLLRTAHGGEAPAQSAIVSAVFATLGLLYAVIIVTHTGRSAPPARREADDATLELQTWRAAGAAIDDIVATLDAAGSVVCIATRHADWFGADTSILIGRGLFEHVHVADRPAFLQHVADSARGVMTKALRIRLRTGAVPTAAAIPAPPAYAFVEVRARRPDFQSTDPMKPSRVVVVLRDVDALNRLEAEAVTAHKSTEMALLTKDQFLASMSHELRTPLNAIIGFSEMLASRTLRPIEADKQRDYAEIIRQSGLHLLSVVNAVLDVSKIRSGTFSLSLESFAIKPLIDQCCDMLALKAEEGRVEIVRDCGADLDGLVGDKRAYKQILINLLSNAVKFTPAQGRVTVSARMEGSSLCLAVRDTGIGIGPADLSQLGDPFFQAPASRDRPLEGAGLGLSVVRGLVGLHGGTIALESEVGRGTCVMVRLPLDCRLGGTKTVSAAIETLPRASVEIAPSRRIDQRVKQIA